MRSPNLIRPGTRVMEARNQIRSSSREFRLTLTNVSCRNYKIDKIGLNFKADIKAAAVYRWGCLKAVTSGF